MSEGLMGTISDGALIVMSIIFLVGSAFRAIIGEYSKKIWFNYIEPRLRRPVTKLLKWFGFFNEPTSVQTISTTEIEIQELREMLERVLIERDAMQLELIRHRVDDNSKDAA